MENETTPYWMHSVALPPFPPISQDVEVDVAIIGGGLTGITTAYLLKKEGVKVALVDRQRCAEADTGHTTAHLTMVTDYRLHQLVKNFGEDCAKMFWEAGAAAIDQIYSIVTTENIRCEFDWLPGYLHASLKQTGDADREALQRDAQLATDLGFHAEFLETVPYANRPGVRFPNQAKFHPRKYLAALLKTIPGEGSYVFENSEASEFEDEPMSIKVAGKRIRCRYLVIATHTPLTGNTGVMSALFLQTKLALYTSYVLGARIPSGTLAEALFWDTGDPYYYLRIDRHQDHDYAIFGGEDCKTGQEQDTEAVFRRLEQMLLRELPMATVTDRWMGQVVETNDGLPFIGETASRQFVATGFCGNGFTLGTVAALMARDQFLRRRNPWFGLFNVNRKKLQGGTIRYLRENMDFPYYLVRDRFAKADGKSLDDVAAGQGKILNLNGRKVAVYRDPAGEVTILNPVCTHLKCIVGWNDADKTWDCPCHGSRFKATGDVLAGPAESALEPIARDPQFEPVNES